VFTRLIPDGHEKHPGSSWDPRRRPARRHARALPTPAPGKPQVPTAVRFSPMQSAKRQRVAFYTSCPAMFTAQQRHPVPPRQRKHVQQVKGERVSLKTRALSRARDAALGLLARAAGRSARPAARRLWGRRCTVPGELHHNKIHKNSNFFFLTSVISPAAAFVVTALSHRFALSSI